MGPLCALCLTFRVFLAAARPQSTAWPSEAQATFLRMSLYSLPMPHSSPFWGNRCTLQNLGGSVPSPAQSPSWLFLTRHGVSNTPVFPLIHLSCHILSLILSEIVTCRFREPGMCSTTLGPVTSQLRRVLWEKEG